MFFLTSCEVQTVCMYAMHVLGYMYILQVCGGMDWRQEPSPIALPHYAEAGIFNCISHCSVKKMIKLKKN